MWTRSLCFQHSFCLGSWKFYALNSDLTGLLCKTKAPSISPAMWLYGFPTAICIFTQTFQRWFNAARTGRPLGIIKTNRIFLEGPETSHYLKYVSTPRSRSKQQILCAALTLGISRGFAEGRAFLPWSTPGVGAAASQSPFPPHGPQAQTEASLGLAVLVLRLKGTPSGLEFGKQHRFCESPHWALCSLAVSQMKEPCPLILETAIHHLGLPDKR